jgi:hypothetical protein
LDASGESSNRVSALQSWPLGRSRRWPKRAKKPREEENSFTPRRKDTKGAKITKGEWFFAALSALASLPEIVDFLTASTTLR